MTSPAAASSTIIPSPRTKAKATHFNRRIHPRHQRPIVQGGGAFILTTPSTATESSTSRSSSGRSHRMLSNPKRGGRGSPAPSDPGGLDKACKIVRSILDQIALGDYPPSNDEPDAVEGSAAGANSKPQPLHEGGIHGTAHPYVQNVPPSSTASLASTLTSEGSSTPGGGGTGSPPPPPPPPSSSSSRLPPRVGYGGARSSRRHHGGGHSNHYHHNHGPRRSPRERVNPYGFSRQRHVLPVPPPPPSSPSLAPLPPSSSPGTASAASPSSPGQHGTQQAHGAVAPVSPGSPPLSPGGVEYSSSSGSLDNPAATAQGRNDPRRESHLFTDEGVPVDGGAPSPPTTTTRASPSPPPPPPLPSTTTTEMPKQQQPPSFFPPPSSRVPGRSEQSMGNVALAALCARTLDSVAGAARAASSAARAREMQRVRARAAEIKRARKEEEVESESRRKSSAGPAAAEGTGATDGSGTPKTTAKKGAASGDDDVDLAATTPLRKGGDESECGGPEDGGGGGWSLERKLAGGDMTTGALEASSSPASAVPTGRGLSARPDGADADDNDDSDQPPRIFADRPLDEGEDDGGAQEPQPAPSTPQQAGNGAGTARDDGTVDEEKTGAVDDSPSPEQEEKAPAVEDAPRLDGNSDGKTDGNTRPDTGPSTSSSARRAPTLVVDTAAAEEEVAATATADASGSLGRFLCTPDSTRSMLDDCARAIFQADTEESAENDDGNGGAGGNDDGAVDAKKVGNGNGNGTALMNFCGGENGGAASSPVMASNEGVGEPHNQFRPLHSVPEAADDGDDVPRASPPLPRDKYTALHVDTDAEKGRAPSPSEDRSTSSSPTSYPTPDGPTMTTSSESPRKRRFQMFGSEYARFLSSTPLSPPDVPRKSRSKLLKRFGGSSSSSGNNSSGSHHLDSSSAHSISSGPPPSSYSVGGGGSSSTPRHGHHHRSHRALFLEDASDAILSGAITDVVVTHGAELPPRGYYRISQTADGMSTNTLLRSSSGGGSVMPGRKGSSVFLNVKKEPNWDRSVQRPCVTALAVIFPDRNEFVPPGFCVVRRYKSRGAAASAQGDGGNKSGGGSSQKAPGARSTSNDGESTVPANLNFGTAGERVYLCYRRSREGNPITGIIPLQPAKGEPIPEGYTVLERTPRNYVADINSKAGSPIFLAFRQRLANLEPLRPLPLVLSVYYSNLNSEGTKKGRKRLRAYYCTGGTVVPSEVGKYHIMDRSTHPLLSPSSVSNRLSLIQASRQSRASLGNVDNSPGGSTGPLTPLSAGSSFDHSATASTSHSSMRSSAHINSKRSTTKASKGQRKRAAASFSLVHGLAASDREDDDSGAGRDMLVQSSFGEVDSIISNSSSDAIGHHLVNSSMDSVGSSTYHSSMPRSPSTSSFCSSHDPTVDTRSSGFRSKGEAVQEHSVHRQTSAVDPYNASRRTNRSVFTHNDSVLQSCFDAMSFVPPIVCAKDLPEEDSEKMTSSLVLQARVTVITPILTSCYTHHGGSTLLAVDGLTSLLNDTDFFRPDISDEVCDEDGFGCSTRLTLLDLAVQVVCDVGTSTSRETNFGSCIDFVSDAMRYASGRLNTRTIGYVLRFYLFVFYFGASVPTLSSWPTSIDSSVRKRGGKSRSALLDPSSDIPLLDTSMLDEHEGSSLRGVYLPGGAPQAAALALKEFISLVLSRLRTFTPSKRQDFMALTMSYSSSDDEDDAMGGLNSFVQDVLSTVIDSATNHVDVANYTQLALHQIHRSGGSELFWHDMMTSCGVGLFGHCDKSSTPEDRHGYITSFALLASLVKVSSGKIRRVAQTTEMVPRDVASKLLSLELLLHFMEKWRSAVFPGITDESGVANCVTSVKTMAYTIRRLVVPCILSNTGSALEDSRVFRRMIRIISELWCTPYYRHHMKMELGVLIEHFVLKMLHFGPQILPLKRLIDLGGKHDKITSTATSFLLDDMSSSLLPQQLDILTEIRRWFASDPADLLELFLNFDLNDESGIGASSLHLNLSRQLCSALCTLAEQCGDIVSEQICATSIVSGNGGVVASSSSGGPSGGISPSQVTSLSAYAMLGEDLKEMARVREGARLLQEKSFDAIGEIAKSFMHCAAMASGEKYHHFLAPSTSQMEADRYTMVPGIENDSFCDTTEEKEEDGNNTVSTSLKPVLRGMGGALKDRLLRHNDAHSSPSAVNDDVPASPRRYASPMRARASSPIPSSPRRSAHMPTSENKGIVDYWQNSIAPERRKASSSPSPGPELRKKMGKSPESPSFSSSNRPPLHTVGNQFIRNNVENEGADAKADTLMKGKGSKSIVSNKKSQDTLKTAFEIISTKSLKKALEYLIACNFLSPAPRDVASFLRIHQARLDPADLGDYLGEGGKDGADVEYWNLIRFNYVRAISFVGMNVEQGLRHFLTNCGFRLPGEAQRIDRIISTFSQCYWEDNAGDHVRCPFRDQDTVFLLSFAIIMLNTDLHKSESSGSSSRKQRKKMTRTEFLNNLRGVDNSEDLSREYLSAIYDSIEAHPIAILNDPTSSGGVKGAAVESIGNSSDRKDLTSLIKALVKNVKPAQELLRGLAVHEHAFTAVRDYSDQKGGESKDRIPKDLICAAVGATWHHFHSIINAALDVAHVDPKGLESCLDLLQFALCTTICLDMAMERSAFVTQLARVKFFQENCEKGQGGSSLVAHRHDHQAHKNLEWYKKLERACSDPSNDNAKIDALRQVQKIIADLHSSLKVDAQLKKEMKRAVRRIRNGEILLNDPARSFLREGDLVKRSNRGGRNTTYRFFLFSDVLVYGHKSSSDKNDYKMHEQLPLYLMKVEGDKGRSNKQQRSFGIQHPRKSFLVYATDAHSKASWVKDIKVAIEREINRKARLEGARLASAAVER